MRIVVVGATGTLGREIAALLGREHEVVGASRRGSPLSVDIADPRSIDAMYAAAGRVDALVSAAGDARFKPLAELTDEDFAFSLANKLMGQVNLVRRGLARITDGGSITITSGVLSRAAAKGSGAVSLVNAALEGFARAAALEAPRGIRVNVVSPPWAKETLRAYGMDEAAGLPAASIARSYALAATGAMNGAVLEPAP